ncbi:MAG: TIGR04086 family membrane protein [Eubacteriales bacterium]|nr:TIGR04086 family membrane protein [Eubacteriales bacterium]
MEFKRMLPGLALGTLLALGVTTAAILVYALILVSAPEAEDGLETFNLILKIFSVAVGTFFALKTPERGWLTGLIVGLAYVTLGFLLFSLIDGRLEPGPGLLLDELLGAVTGVVAGIVTVTIRGKKRR